MNEGNLKTTMKGGFAVKNKFDDARNVRLSVFSRLLFY